MDEADIFYAAPRRFLLDRYGGLLAKDSTQGQLWPTHLVMFETLFEIEDGHGSLRGLLLEKRDNENGMYREVSSTMPAWYFSYYGMRCHLPTV